MAKFVAELKRRHIYRVAAAYAVVAWVLLQLVNNITPIMAAPQWVAQFCLLVLVLGFPLGIFFAWTRELSPPEATSPGKATASDWVLVGALLVVIALVSYQQLVPATGAKSAQQQASVSAARFASLNPGTAIALAVLPFTNLSGDPSQEFFSDGMTEEITSALAKVPDLRVVARTSAFEFKGKNVNIKTMGEQLGATHLIEGSVRKAGNRLRITAQLIKADDGTHIWAEDYDRELTDVFAIQEDIARAITASLRMPLGLKPGENLVNNRNIDPESHEKFLRAKAMFDGRVSGALQDTGQAELFLKEVVAKNPDFAFAWALLGAVYFQRANDLVNSNKPIAETRTSVNEFRTNGEAAARRAIQIDPNLTTGYATLTIFVWSRAKPLETEELYTKALALDSADQYLLDGYTIRIGATGRLKDALASAERARAVEPFLPAMLARNTDELWLNDRNDAAIALAKTLRPVDRAPKLAMIYASMGRYADAADALMEIGGDPNSAAAQAARLLRTAPVMTAAPEKLPRLPNTLEFVYLHVGAPERAITTYERRAEIGFLAGNQQAFVWHSSYASVRKTDRFKALMRKVGLVDYWRAKGWPPQCHPTTGDDFACE